MVEFVAISELILVDSISEVIIFEVEPDTSLLFSDVSDIILELCSNVFILVYDISLLNIELSDWYNSSELVLLSELIFVDLINSFDVAPISEEISFEDSDINELSFWITDVSNVFSDDDFAKYSVDISDVLFIIYLEVSDIILELCSIKYSVDWILDCLSVSNIVLLFSCGSPILVFVSLDSFSVDINSELVLVIISELIFVDSIFEVISFELEVSNIFLFSSLLIIFISDEISELENTSVDINSERSILILLEEDSYVFSDDASIVNVLFIIFSDVSDKISEFCSPAYDLSLSNIVLSRCL